MAQAASLGELFIQLAFEGDTKKAEEFKKKLLDVSKTEKQAKNGLKEVSKAFMGYAAAISGAIFAAKKFTDSLIEQNQTWINLTRTSDIALSTFQKWNAVGKMYGINNAAQQIKNLNDRLFELKLTGANAQGFMLAGIMPTNTEDVMGQLRARVRGLSDTSASYLLRQMGLDENMLHILRLSSSEFKALNAEISRFQLTAEQRKNIQEMNVQLQIASQKLQYLKDRVIVALLPHFISFLNAVNAIGVKIGKFVSGLNTLNPQLIHALKIIASITAGVFLLNKSFKLVQKSILAFKAILLSLKSPLTWLLTGLFLIFDDIATYLAGGESYFGDIMQAIKDFQKNGFFSDDVPKWIQLLAMAADKLYQIYGAAKGIKEIKNLPDNKKTSVTSLAIADLLGKSGLSRTPLGLALMTGALTTSMITNNSQNYQNNPNITINNDIQTTETAKEVVAGFTPYLTFANRNFTMQGI